MTLKGVLWGMGARFETDRRGSVRFGECFEQGYK